MTDRAPDYIEPIVAWRGWTLDYTRDGPCLASVSARFLWLPGSRVEARCDRGHTAPSDICGCGLYAARTLERLREIGYQTHGVIGTVNLYGRVVIARFGFRAQYATIRTLYLPHAEWRHAGPLREAYHVPIRLLDPYAGDPELAHPQPS